MGRCLYIRLLALLLLVAGASAATARNELDTLGAGTVVHFVENLGQWDARVRYEAQLHDAAVFLEEGSLMVALREHTGHPGPAKSTGIRCHAYRMHFVGAAAVAPVGRDKQEGYCNYYLGNDPSRWRSRVGTYLTAAYTGLYDGIDLEIYGGSRALKYNFIVHPGADVSQIALRYEGADKLRIGRDGSMTVGTTVRDVVELKPYVYQMIEGREREVTSRWRLDEDKNTVRIEIGEYDPNEELVVDPVLIFSTYTGSVSDNWGTTAAYDSEKNAYTAGLVFGVDYPVSPGAYQQTLGGGVDVGIFKFDSLGQQRLFATFLGGDKADMPHSLFVNTFDELIVFGTTGSANFPVTPGAYQTSHAGGDSLYYEEPNINYPNGSDLFVSRLRADGTQLQASTYIGGSGNDGLNFRQRYNTDGGGVVLMQGNDSLYYNYGDGARGEIITDNLNNIYLGSTTMSHDFPVTPGCVQRYNGGYAFAPAGKQDGIVLKLDHNLRNLLWSTYIGGLGDDAVYSIDVDSAYNLLICGGTNSADFPVTAEGWQRTYGGGSADGFVSKISYNGDRLMASTYVGNPYYDQLYFVRTGKRDEVFLFGQTQPANTSNMIYNAGYSVYNSGMLLMRMNPDLSNRVWSTLFGTSGRINLSPTAFAADICNRIYAAGWGRDFVNYGGTQWYTLGTTGMETTTDAWMDSTDGQDFYIISIDRDANQLEYATFFGESHRRGQYSGGADHVDGGTSRFDRLATLYQSVCASCGHHNDFPVTAEAWSDSNGSYNCNNALFRFNVADDFPVAEFVPPPAGCAPYAVNFHNTGRGTSFYWDFGDGSTSTERDPSHTFAVGGIYTVTLIATTTAEGCSTADTIRHTVHAISDEAHRIANYMSCANQRVQIGPQPQIGATYQWLSDSVSDPTVANPWVDSSGVYLLRVSAEGCSEVDTFVVEMRNLVESVTHADVSCHGRGDGSISITPDPNASADSLTLALTPSVPMTIDGGGRIVFSPLPAGDYHLTVDGYGCHHEEDITIVDPPLPYYRKTAQTTLCTDSCTGWIHIEYEMATPASQPQADTLIEDLCEGTYVTSLTSGGCPLTDTTRIVRNHQLDNFDAWADKYVLYIGESVWLHCTEVEGATYTWQPATDLEQPTAPNTLARPQDSLPCYSVEVVTADGCTASDTLCLRCSKIRCGEPEYFIPNAFTPNDDGVNDAVEFGNPILSELHIAVFNRWGECVFEGDNPTQCSWDGTYRNTQCLPGVYTYTCRIRCHNNEEAELKGDITLIR
jgi:gliding motility-associated-like protein